MVTRHRSWCWKMSVEEIRSCLKSGDTIDDVCRKYHLTFQELVMRLHQQPKVEKVSRCKELYITVIDGRYVLRKNHVYYGRYYTLEDAKKVRDYFIMNRWNKRRLNEVCRELGVERVKKTGVNKYG